MKIRIQRPADFLHGHAHDAVNIVLCEKGQAGAFTLEDFIPGFRYGPGRIPEGPSRSKINKVSLHNQILLQGMRTLYHNSQFIIHNS